MSQKQLFDTANQLSNEGKFHEALELAATLLQHYPDKSSYLALAGKIMADQKYFGLAIPLIESAIANLPKGKEYDLNRAEYYNNLGFCSRFLNKYDKGIKYFRNALKYANDKQPDIYGNLATLYVARGETDEGLRLVQKALDAYPDDESALNNKSVLLLEKGDYEAGFGIYDSRMVLKEEGKKWKQYPGNPPLWDGTKGQTVIVHGEQGIGDEIMFASCLPDIAKDCKVIFDCNDRLMNIFRSSFDFDIYGTKKENERTLKWVHDYKVDAFIPIGSLPRFYRKTAEDFPCKPFLTCNPDAVARIGERVKALGKRKKIGISWLGGTVDTHCWERHIPIALLNKLTDLDVDFISLQYDNLAEEEVTKSGLPIHHWTDIIKSKDYEETAALVSNLDLVISVPQSVVHLSGALGIPTWQLTPKRAMWQMGVYGQDMPWYPVKSYWQDKAGDWEPVINKVVEDLSKFHS